MPKQESKRNATLSDDWLRDEWNLRELDYGEDELASYDRLLSSAVARCLKAEDRPEIADTLSSMMGEPVTLHMLNAYASEARREFRIPASRFLALIAVTRRFDILDAVLREIGGKAVDRHGAKALRVGAHYIDYLNAGRVLREDAADLFEPFEP